MENATVERLSRLIGEPEPEINPEKKWRRRVPHQVGGVLSHLRLAEGWFSFFLVVLVVYSTIWCVQAVGWVANLSLLTPVTALGLLMGIIAAKQQRLPRALIHGLAIVLGILIAFWQTCAADYAGQASAFFANIRTWFSLAFSGGTSNDDSIFLFLILVLGFLLAYTSMWLVYRTRSPWLMLLANAVVLLLNLSNIDAGYVIFLIVFLIAALLLLLRFNLYESSQRWKRQGLRCSDDLHWEFMQAGVLVSLAILVFSWVLPWGYTNSTAAQIWNTDNSPWVLVQNAWNRLVDVTAPQTPQNHGSFANTLTLGGNPELVALPVFQVKTTDGSQYLMSVSYDRYDGVRNWYNSAQVGRANKANKTITDGMLDQQAVTQTVTVVNAPGEQYPYLFGASQIVASNQNAHLYANRADNETIAWLRDNGKLASGDVYTVISDVSSADQQSLRKVPMPQNESRPPSNGATASATYFDPNILKTYTQVPTTLDPAIKALAMTITGQISNMYDKVTALETYLRDHYIYDSAITAPPPGVEATSWFLFQEKRGYCNYFATAMTLLARELGIPARVAVGYTDGKYDEKLGQWVVTGTDAHAWTQVYFAGYGWVNFEPSQSFSLFTRPLVPPSSNSIGPTNPTGTATPGRTNRPNLPIPAGLGPNGAGTGSADIGAQIRLDIGIVLLVLVVLLLSGFLYFRLWWRRLFHGLSLPSQIYGRVCTLAGWAGLATKRSQTPHEYMQTLSLIAPEETVTFERLGDIYARERWADPLSAEHPARSGEASEVPGLWKSLQPRLVRYVLRHPYFLKLASGGMSRTLGRLSFRRTTRSASTVVVEEEFK